MFPNSPVDKAHQLPISARLQLRGLYNEAQATLCLENENIALRRERIIKDQLIADLKKQVEILSDPTKNKNREHSLNG